MNNTSILKAINNNSGKVLNELAKYVNNSVYY